MKDKASNRVSEFTKSWLELGGLIVIVHQMERLMCTVLHINGDFNSIELLWSILKRGIYHNGMPNNKNYDLWEEEKVTPVNVTCSMTANLTSHIDNRSMSVFKKKGESMQ